MSSLTNFTLQQPLTSNPSPDDLDEDEDEEGLGTSMSGVGTVENEDEQEEEDQQLEQLLESFQRDHGVTSTLTSSRSPATTSTPTPSRKKAKLSAMMGASVDDITDVVQGHLSEDDDPDHDIDDAMVEAMAEEMLQGNKDPQKLSKSQRRKQAKRKRQTRVIGGTMSAETEKLLGEAHAAYIGNDFRTAHTKLLQVVQKHPRSPAPYHTLGLIYEEQQLMGKAIQMFLIAALLTPKDMELWRRVGIMAYDAGLYGQCIHCLNKVIRASPDDMDARLVRAQAQQATGDDHRAIESYVYLLTKFPYDTNIIRNLTQLYHLTKQTGKATNLVEGYVHHYQNIWKKRKDAEAEGKTFDEPLEPIDLNLINVLCELYLDHRRYQRLITLMSTLKSIRDESIDTIHHITDGSSGHHGLPIDLSVKYGIALQHLGQEEQAEMLFNELYSHDVAKYGDLYFDVGEAYQATGQLERALSAFESLTGHRKLDTPLLWQRIATCLRLLCTSTSTPDITMQQRAITYYERVLQHDHENVDARLGLAELYREVGEWEKAREMVDSVSLTGTVMTDPSMVDEDGVVRSRPISHSMDGSEDVLHVIRDESTLRILGQKGAVHFHAHEYMEFLNTCLAPVKSTIAAASGQLVDEVPPLESADGTIAPKPTRIRSPTASTTSLVLNAAARASASPADMDAASVASTEDLMLLQKRKGPARILKKPPARGPSLEIIARRILRAPTFLELVVRTCKALSKLNRYVEALRIVQSCEQCLMDHNYFPLDTPAKRHLHLLRIAAVGIAYHAEDYEEAYHFIRFVIPEQPYSMRIGHIFNQILNKLEFHHKCVRFLERTLNKHPQSIPLLILVGHSFLMHRNYEFALQHYVKAYVQNSTQPSINLFIGITTLQIAMMRKTAHRHHAIMRAFSFLFNYFSLRHGDAEACYNVARAFHYIGCHHLAIPYYEKVLARCHTSGELRHEAAHNLAIIYQHSGSVELARRVYAEYNTI